MSGVLGLFPYRGGLARRRWRLRCCERQRVPAAPARRHDILGRKDAPQVRGVVAGLF